MDKRKWKMMTKIKSMFEKEMYLLFYLCEMHSAVAAAFRCAGSFVRGSIIRYVLLLLLLIYWLVMDFIKLFPRARPLRTHSDFLRITDSRKILLVRYSSSNTIYVRYSIVMECVINSSPHRNISQSWATSNATKTRLYPNFGNGFLNCRACQWTAEDDKVRML